MPQDRWTGPARVLALVAAGIALIMAFLPNPPPLPGNPSDKLVHAATFGLLALLIAQGWPRAGFWAILLPLSAFGAGIEIAQGTSLIHRDASLGDWLADTAAIAIALALLAPTRRQASVNPVSHKDDPS
jgi:VanZ family protein